MKSTGVIRKRSFARPCSRLCHCMLLGTSGPPLLSGMMWSSIKPGHAPDVSRVAGHGFGLPNARPAAGLLAIRSLLSRVQDEQYGAFCAGDRLWPPRDRLRGVSVRLEARSELGPGIGGGRPDQAKQRNCEADQGLSFNG